MLRWSGYVNAAQMVKVTMAVVVTVKIKAAVVKGDDHKSKISGDDVIMVPISDKL